MKAWWSRWSFPLYMVVALAGFSPLRELGCVPSPGELGLLLWLPWMAPRLLRRPLAHLPFLPLPLALLLAWLFLGSALQQALAGWLALKLVAQFSGCFMLYLVCESWLFGEPERQARLEATLVFIAALVGLVCAAQMVLGPIRAATIMPWGPDWTIFYEGLGFRTYGLLDNPLLAGSLMTVCLPLALAHWRTGLRFRLALGLILLGILFTGSRSCIAVALLILACQCLQRVRHVLLGLLAAPVLIAMVLLSPFGSRFAAMSDPMADENLVNRFAASGAALCMIADAPLFGVGPGAFSEVYGAQYKPLASQDQVSAYTSDNLILQLTAEGGLPAGALALIAFLWAIFTALRWSPWQRGISTALLAHALLSLVVALFATPLMWLLMILFALAERSRDKKRAETYPAVVGP